MDFITSIFYNRQEERVRAGWRIIIHFILLAVVSGILMAPLILTDNMNNRMLQTIIMLVSFSVATFIIGYLLDKRKISGFGFKLNADWIKDFLFGLFLGALLMALIFLFQTSTGMTVIKETHFSFASIVPLLFGLLVFIMVGFYEELFSRGYHLINLTEGIFHKSLGMPVTIFFSLVISSSVFGLGHIGNPGATLVSTVNIIIAGFLLAAGMVFTKQLAIPIGLHISWNYFQGNIFGFAVSGTSVNFSLLETKTTGSELITGGAFGPEAGLTGLFAMFLGMALIVIYLKLRYKSLSLKVWEDDINYYQNRVENQEHNDVQAG